MTARTRQGAVFLAVALVGGVLVFQSVLGVVRRVEARLGPPRPALVLVADVPAYTPVTVADVRVVDYPARYLPAAVLASPEQIGGRVAGVALRAGSYLQDDVLVDPPAVAVGDREITVAFGVETAVGGDLAVGDRVDLIAVYRDPATKAVSSQVVLRSTLVLAVRRLTDGPDLDGVLALTFAVPAATAAELSRATVAAEALRLVKLPPQEAVPPVPPQEAVPPLPPQDAVDGEPE